MKRKILPLKERFITAEAIKNAIQEKIATETAALGLIYENDEDIAKLIEKETELSIKYNWLEIENNWKKAKNDLFNWAENRLKIQYPKKWKLVAICFEPLNRITYQDELINICLRIPDYD